MDQVLCLAEVAAPYLKKHRLEMSLPLGLRNSLGVLHNLSCSLILAPHLEVLGVLEHRHRHLLLRYLVAASLDDLPRPLVLSQMELNTRSDQPDLPLDIVGAVLDRIEEESHRLLTVPLALVGLSRLDVDLPVKLPRHILENFVEDCLDAVEPLQPCFLGNFFI